MRLCRLPDLERTRIMIIAGIVAALLIVLILAAGFGMAKYAVTGRRQTLEEARAWQEGHYDLSWYDSLEKTDYTVTCEDGYALHAQYLKNPDAADRFVLISHGYTDNRFGALKYARIYLELGFNVIIYDLRGHGQNEPAFCTYSVRERKDLLALIRDSLRRWPNPSLFGLHGESLGAATSVAVLEEKPPVDFVVADCGFSEIMPILENGIRKMNLPVFLVRIASLCAKVRYGYSFGEMRPVESLKENRIPVLFIHGAEDDFIPPEHSEKMKNATQGYAEIRLIPGAGHAQSVLKAPDAYREYVTGFLKKLFPDLFV